MKLRGGFYCLRSPDPDIYAGIWRPLLGIQPCAKDMKPLGKLEVRVIIVWTQKHAYICYLFCSCNISSKKPAEQVWSGLCVDEGPEAEGGKGGMQTQRGAGVG